MERAKNGLIELFFMDAAHFVMGGFPARVWWFARVFGVCKKKRVNGFDNFFIDERKNGGSAPKPPRFSRF